MSSHPEHNRSAQQDSQARGTRHVEVEGTGVVLERILPYLANRLTFRMNQLLNKDLRRHGLTIANWRVLAVLDFNEKASVNELANYAMIEQSTLSRLIMRMEADGLLRRERVDADGRVRSISMTPAGRRKYETVRALTLAHAERATIGLSAEEKAVFERVISVMRANLEKHPLPRTIEPT
ncbi:MarR family winged helix-turn-helix transcriptional regulator [Pararhizobium haloflavum]|uniref:MarR family winged helix-turn-helix transcriptional regulator n=1 Tax=Pararhizobium haloflavum TaxID=2037914 RepID=UPI000C177F54|nr:MarR family transcriptional regulator [Pararhizobium haloflavum]